MTNRADLAPFFYPDSLAVVGASLDEDKPSGIVLKNIQASFSGRIYPVNPGHEEVLGLKCYPSVSALPEAAALSIIITAPAIIPGLLREHAARGIRHVIIASAGFGETESGAGLENELRHISRESGIRIIGPNCLGIFHPSAGLDTFFLPRDRVPRPGKGNISIISQSGSILGTAMILLEREGLGVAKAVSYGNRVDVTETELLEYLSMDNDTEVIGLCIESISDGRDFIKAAQKCRKPIIAMKLGKEPAGKKASRSHTGSISGKYEIFRAAFMRSGISEAGSLEDLVDLLKVFSMRKPRQGNRVLIVTNAGGIGVMTADHCNEAGLDVPDMPQKQKDILRKELPPYYSLSNPVDLTGSSKDRDFVLVLDTCLDCFDAAILIPFMTVSGLTRDLGKAIAASVKRHDKPVISLHPYSSEGRRLEEDFVRSGIPLFPSPLRAIRALSQLLRKKDVEPLTEEGKDYPEVSRIIAGSRRQGQTIFLPEHKQGLLKAMHLKHPRSIRAGNLTQTIAAAKRIGFPVAVKIASPDILHKTDAGGVRLNIRNTKELKEAYHSVMLSAERLAPNADITGVDVEEMIPAGIELIIGGLRDPQFGPVVMFGLGGIFVEAIRDVAFEIAPLTPTNAQKMIESVKGYTLLRGIRGQKGADIDSIARAIVRISKIFARYPEIEEFEVNPAIASPSGIVAADVRMILSE